MQVRKPRPVRSPLLMGTSNRRKPKHLAKKLLAIRNKLGASQTEMAKLLDLQVAYTVVSSFELAKREPDLVILLRYAKLAGISTDVLIDDRFSIEQVRKMISE
jgi:transcriptional regulator with XRE-family HTH domain